MFFSFQANLVLMDITRVRVLKSVLLGQLSVDGYIGWNERHGKRKIFVKKPRAGDDGESIRGSGKRFGLTVGLRRRVAAVSRRGERFKKAGRGRERAV